MVIIDGRKIYEQPAFCGQCPFLFDYSTHMTPAKGPLPCTLFNEMHRYMTTPPRRCQKLFKTAFEYFNDSGLDLSIVKNQNKEQ